MNLLQFMNCVDETAANLSQDRLAKFIHDMARVLPERQREEFLKNLQAMQGMKAPEGSQPPLGGNGIGKNSIAAETEAVADMKNKLKQIKKM